jgi:hypothetical protein
MHLRLCTACGHVDCCVNSANCRATSHWNDHGDHALIRSCEPGEEWCWCYADETFFELDDAPPAPSRPSGNDQERARPRRDRAPPERPVTR